MNMGVKSLSSLNNKPIYYYLYSRFMDKTTRWKIKEVLKSFFIILFIGIIIPFIGLIILNRYYGLSAIVYLTSASSSVTSAIMTILIIEYSKKQPGIKNYIEFSIGLYVILLIIGLIFIYVMNINISLIVEIFYSSLFGVCIGFAFTIYIETAKKIWNK